MLKWLIWWLQRFQFFAKMAGHLQVCMYVYVGLGYLFALIYFHPAPNPHPFPLHQCDLPPNLKHVPDNKNMCPACGWSPPFRTALLISPICKYEQKQLKNNFLFEIKINS
jgi:hypothetical protein